MQGNQASYRAGISADARYVAFESQASNLVLNDTNGWMDVFVYDRVAGTTVRVSVSSTGDQANWGCLRPSISSNGRYVVFESYANNLVVGDTNSRTDIFVHDRISHLTRRVSIATGGAQSNGESARATVSSDGRFVAFESKASNLVASQPYSYSNIYLHDRTTATTSLISYQLPGPIQFQFDSYGAQLSSDGRFVAFSSVNPNLVPGDTNSHSDVFVHDRVAGTTTIVSLSSAGVQADADTGVGAISSDGRYVVMFGSAGNLIPGDTNGAWDVFVRDRVSGSTSLVSVGSGGSPGNGSSTCNCSISADGRYIEFTSNATNLVSGDTNGYYDVFVRDQLGGATSLVSLAASGAQPNSYSNCSAMSGDGRYVAFESGASNLVPGDTNATGDVFVRDTQTSPTPQARIWIGTTPIVLPSLIEGAPSPASVPRVVKNIGDPGSWLSWHVDESPAANWVSVAPWSSNGSGVAQGSLGQSVTISFATTNLAPGQYATNLVFKNNNDTSDTTTLPVSITIAPAIAPDLELNNASLIVKTYHPGGAAPPSDLRNVLNVGGASTLLSWRVKTVPANTPWLSVSPSIGAVSGGGSNPVTISYTPQSTPIGTHQASLLFENSLNPLDNKSLPLQLTVSPAPPGSGVNQLQLGGPGGVTVYFDQFTVSGPLWQVSGNVSIENLLGISGTAAIDTSTNSLQTSSALTLLTPAGPIPMLSGNIVLGAQQAQLSLSPGAGLNHALQVGGLKIEIDRVDVYLAPVRGVGIGGKVVLPAELGHSKVTINNLTWMENTQRFDLVGVFTQPTVQIPGAPWRIEPLYVSFDTIGGNFGISGTLKLNVPPGLNVNASATMVGGQLDSIAASYTNGPEIPIGTTGFAIRGLGGSVSGFAQPPLTLGATINLTTTPGIPIPNNNIRILTADIGAQLTASPQWVFQLDGAATMFDPDTPIAGNIFFWAYSYDGLPFGNVHTVLEPTGFYGVADLNFLDILVGNAWLTVRRNTAGTGVDVNGSVSGAVQIPAGWPLGPATLAQNIISFNNNGVVATGYIGPIAATLSVMMDGRIEFLGPPAESFGLNIAAGTTLALFRARPLAGTLQEFQLVSPTGLVFTPQNSPAAMADLSALTQIATYLGPLGSDGSLWFAVQNPEVGTWDTVLIGQTPIADTTVIVGNERPRVVVSAPANDVQGTSVLVSYSAFDRDDVATVRYYLDRDQVGFDGTPIGPTDLEVDGPGSRTLDLSSWPAGQYFLVVEADDGRSAPARAYAPGRVTIAPSSALAAPTMVVTTPEDDGSLTLRWNRVQGAAGYRATFAPERGGDPHVIEVHGAGNTTVSLETQPGQRYAVCVTAIDAAGAPGLPSSTAVSLARVAGANNAPVLQGSASVIARVGAPMLHRVPGFDANNDALSYALTTAQAGMSIGATSGQLSWTPPADLVGRVPFQVQVTDSHGASALRDYVVGVVAAIDPNLPPQIGSCPDLVAQAGALYEFDVNARDPEGGSLTYVLDEGPSGMTLGASNGQLRWTPAIADVGPHAVAFHVTDGNGASEQRRYTLEVGGAPSATVFRLGEDVAGALPLDGLTSYVFEAVAGTRAAFAIAASGGTIEPRARLYGTNGAVLGEWSPPVVTPGTGGQPGHWTESLAPIQLTQTGLYRVDVYAANGTAGSWVLFTRGRSPRQIVLDALVSPSTAHDFQFEAVSGRVVELATVRKASGELIPSVEVIDPAGQFVDLTYYRSSSPVGNLISLDDLPITQLGTWTVRVRNDATATGHAFVRVLFAP
ncbi:MAG: hypothetical protein IT454_19780 [Planctomycetes bacterium]|nr:hypothetical protein [Planctomycetota bacterium]